METDLKHRELHDRAHAAGTAAARTAGWTMASGSAYVWLDSASPFTQWALDQGLAERDDTARWGISVPVCLMSADFPDWPEAAVSQSYVASRAYAKGYTAVLAEQGETAVAHAYLD